MIADFDTPDTTDMGCRNKNESAYVKLSPSFKLLCQCILDDNETLIRYVRESLDDITNTVTQNILNKGDGDDTFRDAEFVVTELPTATRKRKLKQNRFAYS